MPNEDHQLSAASGKAPASAEIADNVVSPLSLSAFKLEQATVEIRYPLALPLWDKAGVLWQSMQDTWPDLTNVSAEPAKTVFKRPNVSLMVEMEAARLTSTAPDKPLEEFGKDAKEFVNAVIQHLRITYLKRVGFRLVYYRDCGSREKAASAFFSLDLLKVPENKRFEVSDSPVTPQYHMRWESEVKGVYLQVRAEGRKIDFEPPQAVAHLLKPMHSETFGITFDVDYYTEAPVEPAQFDVAEWTKHAVHIINRDTKFVFGE